MKIGQFAFIGFCAISLHIQASTPQYLGSIELSTDYPTTDITVLGTTGYISTINKTGPGIKNVVTTPDPFFYLLNAENSKLNGTINTGGSISYRSLSTSSGTLYGLLRSELLIANGFVYSLDSNLNPVTQIELDDVTYNNLKVSGTTGYLSRTVGKPPYQDGGFIGVFDTTKMGAYGGVAPLIQATYSVIGKPFGMDVKDDILYVASYDGFINLYNKYPDNFIGSFSAQGTATDIQIAGTTAFVSCQDKINYFDLSDNNKFLGSLISEELPSVGNLAIYNNSLGYVLTGRLAPITGNRMVGYFSTGQSPGPVPSNLTQAGGGNGAAIAGMLNQLNGNCPQATQGIIDFLSVQNQPDQINDLNELAPAFKILQFTLEKLDLLLQKELDDSLYGRQKGNVPFLIAGYNNLTQLKNKPYNGYTSNDCYQLLGMTGSFEKARWMAGVGASESWANTKSQKAHASYNTIWGTLGFSKMRHRYQVGIKGLFGYSFINANRTITFLDEKAKTNHGAYNISVDGRFSLVYRFGKTQVTPYDNLGYIYGHENNYTEHGAPGANLHISNEQISMLRNSLGLSLDTVAYKHVKFFLDGAWVYDHNFKSTKYNGSFVGTDQVGIFNQPNQTSNFGRAQLGFMNDRDDFTWRLCYTGLFGKKFYDNAISLKIAYKF